MASTEVTERWVTRRMLRLRSRSDHVLCLRVSGQLTTNIMAQLGYRGGKTAGPRWASVLESAEQSRSVAWG